MAKREKRLPPIKPGRAQRQRYLDALRAQVATLKAQTGNLADLIASGATRTQVAARIAELSAQAQSQVDALAPGVARSFVSDVDRQNKADTQRAISRALSVDFTRVVDDEAVRGEVDMALTRNTALIRSIPGQHWGAVAEAVLDNYRGKPLPGDASLLQRLKDIGGVSDSRAQLIARDQTSKLVGALNQTRQQANGITEYEWVTAKDRRVVGTPGGAYPKASRAHGNHFERDGKRYRWDSPPADGHPGEAINCRCFARPVFDPKALAAKYGLDD